MLRGVILAGLSFSHALVALAQLAPSRAYSQEAHNLWIWLLLPIWAGASCRLRPTPSPVPVQGTRAEVKALSGEWTGHYWSKATGRHGTIRFYLPEQADTGYGEVEITFSPALLLVRDASARDEFESQPKTCTSIDIRMVRVEADRVQGTMAPYWDPDCDCRAQSVFEGKISGSRITGSFSSRRESEDRRILVGEWWVQRE